MVRSEIISAMSANRLYWLGRYEERVYLTLRMLSKYYDKMIDGVPSGYVTFWRKLDSVVNYKNDAAFTLGMMYDEKNPASVFSAQCKAMDNAMMLRETISSETLSYLEMSVAKMRELKTEKEMNINRLQQITDWSLAFFGCAEQRTRNHTALALLLIGRNIENLDMLLRFDYPLDRIVKAWESLKNIATYETYTDQNITKKIDMQMTQENYNDINFKNRVLSLLSVLTMV